jgi:hypothetical protein
MPYGADSAHLYRRAAPYVDLQKGCCDVTR